jgi:hypothetical protein
MPEHPIFYRQPEKQEGRFRVSPHGHKWGYFVPDNDTPVSLHDTKADAIEAANRHLTLGAQHYDVPKPKLYIED